MQAHHPDFMIFTGNANPGMAAEIAQHLGITLGAASVGRFSDGEVTVEINQNVRARDVFVVQSTCAPTNENLMELLIMVDALKRASAERISAVIPYFGYARQDKKIKAREPISAKLVATLITAAGAHRVLTMDLHALQIQGFFDFPVDHLHAGPIMADHLIECGLCGHDVVVVSPDVGGVSMARAFADRIGADFAIVVKRRPGPNRVEVIEVIGDVKDRTCVLVDDMVDTAGSLLGGVNALFERGARAACACATHPVLSGNAIERIQASPLRQLVVTDTIPISEDRLSPKIEVLSVAPVLAEAIRRIHENASVSTLFRNHGKSD